MRRSLAAVLALLCAAEARAGNQAVTAAPVLQVPQGSRALGMGGAFTAVASDSSGLYYNPAGLSRMNAHEVAFTYMTGLVDDRLQNIAYGGPLPFSGISGNGYASVGASLLYSQSGTIEVNRTNPDGSFLSTDNLRAGSDLVGSFGYAERVGSTPLDVKEESYGINHFVGIGGKVVRSTLVQQYTAATFTGDVGYLVNSPEAGLTFGASALNIGGRLRYVDEGDPLPTTVRSGLAYQGGAPAIHAYTLAADGEYLLHERQFRANLGLEYFWLKSYGVRVGYQFLQDGVGLTVGLGLRWRSRLLLDYAWSMSGTFSDQHRFTVSWRFGGVAPGVRGRARRPEIEAPPEREPIKGLEEKTPIIEPAERPRPMPREERPGLPGWIY